ncbi:uncharacterized protein LOC131009695 [Salvia miltiorrhiza]|uniref:uncharacterized protein LOC131009695 n=1 Tax=Salvia miltiorrhiza TaxID=226208 RepID=UPI0025AC1AB9|nr:uncharacterized protein LOC131009695 [Salvia miltiorrhiza]
MGDPGDGSYPTAGLLVVGCFSCELSFELSAKASYRLEDKNEESESSDDDDFEVVHPRVQIANLMDVRCKRRGVKENFPKKKKVRQIMASVPGLRTRTSPASLFKKISLMNEAQKQAVRDMGFGSVLQLGVRKLPGKLAFWVVEHFDCKSCSIVVGGNQGIRVDEDDVYRVYGFPKGKKEIEIFKRKHRSPLYDEWLAFFEDSTKDDIKITHVLDVMIERVDADIWFKRHFIIAMACCLIESMTSGTVHPYILNCLHDMDKLREWNWGAYVLDSACDQRLSWDKNKKKVFAGPALFLTCLYVDRIQVFGSSPSRREFPIISNWTTSTLLKRQKKELVNSYFGGGRLRTPIKLPDEYQIQHETDGRNLADEQPKKSSTDGYGQHINLGLRIMQEAVAIAVENASRIENFKRMVSTATTLDLNDQTFKDNVITACKMLGIEININELSKAQDETNIGVDENQDQPLDSNDMSLKDTGMPASDINELSKAQDETNIGVDKNQDQPLDSNDMSLKDTGMPASDMLGVEMNINPVEKSQDPANIFLYDDPIFESELVDLVDKASAESDTSKTKHFECAFDIPTFDLHFTSLDPTKEHDNTYQQKESLEVAGIERNDGYQIMTGNNVKDVHANNVDVSKIKEKPLRDKDTSSADLGLNKDSDMQKAVEVKNNKGNEPLTYISAYGVRIRGKPAASIGSPLALGDVGKGKEASSGKNVGVPKDD